MKIRGSNVRDQTRLLKRSGVYYFRAKIPADLQPHMGGQMEAKQSLQTKDKAVCRRANRLKASLECCETFL